MPTMPRDQAILPTEDQIRQRAYEIYRERGAEDGQELADWLKAEAELNAAQQPIEVTGAEPVRAGCKVTAAGKVA